MFICAVDIYLRKITTTQWDSYLGRVADKVLLRADIFWLSLFVGFLENGVQTSAFRGRPIKSQDTAIPDGYTGML